MKFVVSFDTHGNANYGINFSMPSLKLYFKLLEEWADPS